MLEKSLINIRDNSMRIMNITRGGSGRGGGDGEEIGGANICGAEAPSFWGFGACAAWNATSTLSLPFASALQM